jgi:hypothetical protein
MRRGVWGAIFLLAGMLSGSARPIHHAESEDSGTPLKVGGLTFAIPDRWVSEPPEGPARVAQWHIPPPRGQAGEGLEVVVFFFGPGVGGSAQENIDAWTSTVTTTDGRAITPDTRKREVAGHRITQALLDGIYSQASLQPGIPPAVKPACGLLGAVVENPAGNIYWRVTGPAAELALALPVLTQVLDSLKPQDKP